jgi:hypothetical protein
VAIMPTTKVVAKWYMIPFFELIRSCSCTLVAVERRLTRRTRTR